MGYFMVWALSLAAILGLMAWKDNRVQMARETCRMDGGRVLEVEFGGGFVCLPDNIERQGDGR